MTRKNLLIIGKPHSTKSTFLIQLYSKLTTGLSRVKIYKALSNITAITEGRKKLAKGIETDPTPPESTASIEFHLQVGDNQVDLNCLDYGGEQINKIIRDREVSKDWQVAIKNSNNWVLFIRIGGL